MRVKLRYGTSLCIYSAFPGIVIVNNVKKGSERMAVKLGGINKKQKPLVGKDER